MRGRVSINETFMKHQINLDDTEEADVLQHLLPSISFIQAELDKGRGVLVHCQAGMKGRSATIVAAYLMYSQNIDAATAIDMIRKARPSVQPNDGFMHQLEIFHQAAFKVSRRDKAVRMFYLERAVEEILNGDGSAPETDMFAKFPRTPSDSAPATPGGPRRRIRCKMCRQELAAREHMLDHGQIGPPTPAGVLSPATSRRASMNGRPSRHPSATASRRPSAGASAQTRPRVGSGAGSDTRPRRPSLLSFEGSVLGGMAASLSMSALETEDENDSEGLKSDSAKEKDATAARRTRTPSDLRPRRPSGPQNVNSLGGFAAALSKSALDSEDEDSDVAGPMRLMLPEPHAATRKGRLIVVTRIACFNRDFSEMPDRLGRKWISASNGRCDGSADGSLDSRRFELRDFRERLDVESASPAEGMDSRRREEESGEGGLDLVLMAPFALRKRFGGGARAPSAPPSSDSSSS
ncbi:hypothetical protein EWM64_g2347 [Hericium alpestre]|uniref:protein-tyrosine-phosphatase n=1 Tax=Hericium alpestre TaxID=135208 RepID=A0A4Z0A5Q5_9AGAM|nr:hypothetical protein EWM64_g2347 [Hericium alpestre]